MGNLVNLRHIISNNTKRLDGQFVSNLYESSKSANILRSNIYYEIGPNYIRVEYVAKSIPEFIYENEILNKESILTIYSSDFGLADSYIIFDSKFKGDFNFKRTYFEFEEIEIEGSNKDISNFLNYLHKTNHIKHNREKWNLKENGTMQLNTHNNEIFFASNNLEYKMLEVKSEKNSLIVNDFELISISNTNRAMSERFVNCFYNLINNPEEFNELRKLKFIKQDKVIAMIEFDIVSNKWKMLQQEDLVPYVSNIEFVNEMNKIVYR